MSAQPATKKALAEIWGAEDKNHAEAAHEPDRVHIRHRPTAYEGDEGSRVPSGAPHLVALVRAGARFERGEPRAA